MLFPHAFAATLAPSEYNSKEGTTTLDKDITVYQGDNVPDHVTITGNNSVIDGGGFQGFHFVGTRTNPNTIEITVSGVKEFTNFTDKVDGSSSTFEGGAVFAITYGGKLNFEGYSKDNRLLFSGSKAASDGHSSAGSAIMVEGGGTIGDIYADFTNNILSGNETDVKLQYARGGAICIGNSNTLISTASRTGNIHGHFTGNSAEYGGALYIGRSGFVGDISGSFKHNFAQSTYKTGSTTGGCGGGAIRSLDGTIGDINADFEGNVSYAGSSYAAGGAIALQRSGFTSDTLTNKSKATITGYMKNNIAFSEGESVAGGGRGGALSLLDQKAGTELTLIDSDLIGNIAGTALNDSSLVTGGAVYLSNFTNLNIKAQTKDVLISGNYETWGATFTKKENGLGATVSGGLSRLQCHLLHRQPSHATNNGYSHYHAQ